MFFNQWSGRPEKFKVSSGWRILISIVVVVVVVAGLLMALVTPILHICATRSVLLLPWRLWWKFKQSGHSRTVCDFANFTPNSLYNELTQLSLLSLFVLYYNFFSSFGAMSPKDPAGEDLGKEVYYKSNDAVLLEGKIDLIEQCSRDYAHKTLAYQKTFATFQSVSNPLWRTQDEIYSSHFVCLFGHCLWTV